jgi:hypothetical protein
LRYAGRKCPQFLPLDTRPPHKQRGYRPDFVEPNAPKKTIKIVRSHDERHAGSNCLILNERNLHRSPGHQADGGSLAEIFVDRSAMRWLRLYGYSRLQGG